MNQDYQRGYMEGYIAALLSQNAAMLQPMDQLVIEGLAAPSVPEMKPAAKKRRQNAYQKRYKSAFRRIAPKYKLKSGKWKAGGFKKAVKQAHKEAKK